MIDSVLCIKDDFVMLSVSNLTKHFTQKDQKTKSVRTVGINDITFSVSPGRILGLVGPNGAGKTTTMRIIAGLTNPQKGVVQLNNKNTASIKGYKKHVSLISAETQPYDRLTPREQLELAYRLAGLNIRLMKETIQNLSHELTMDDFLDKPNLSFSSGMKQKISIARGLVTNPDIVVFDEVTNGLDIFAARAVKEQVLKLKDAGKHIIFSTHILSDADELCDDIVVIHKGVVREIGEKKALLKKYKVGDLEELFFAIVGKEEEYN